MGKTFDPAKPEDYIKSFAIKRRRERLTRHAAHPHCRVHACTADWRRAT